jgi:hypothetical protein
MGARVSITQAEIQRAKVAAENAGLRLTAVERKPDGTIRVEFGENKPDNDWWTGSPLLEDRP